MVTVCKLMHPGQGGGCLAVGPPFCPSEMSYFLLHSWDWRWTLQAHNGCAQVEMALSAVPLPQVFAYASLSHSSIRCLLVFRPLLFSTQHCIGNEGSNKGNSDVLRHH